MAIAGKPRSRREFLGISLPGSLALAGLCLGASRALADRGKVPKRTLAYQESPKNGQKCSECLYWQGGNQCSKVEGRISPDGWCVLFVPS